MTLTDDMPSVGARPHPLVNALIVVDVQVDFCPGGSLSVQGGDKIAASIYEYVREHEDEYRLIVATKDWHPDIGFDFEHFAEQPNFSTTWPIHCVAYTDGAKFHPNLRAVDADGSDVPVPGFEFDGIFLKGQKTSAYSAFDNPDLDTYLKTHGVGHVDVCGLATDYCVSATAIDAAKHGYTTACLLDLCAGVAPDTTDEAISDMQEANVEVVAS